VSNYFCKKNKNKINPLLVDFYSQSVSIDSDSTTINFATKNTKSPFLKKTLNTNFSYEIE
jgi:hypothetical protein